MIKASKDDFLIQGILNRTNSDYCDMSMVPGVESLPGAGAAGSQVSWCRPVI
jgi:hypothetical protein